MKKLISFLILFLLLVAYVSGQDAKFGGPFTTCSFNHRGPTLSVGGGGTFFIVKNFYIGVFGQGTTDLFERESYYPMNNYVMKSRQTGFWIGYNHKFKNSSKLSTSLYNKVGFGQVYLNNSKRSINYYDKTIIFTPNLELAYRISSFFEIGLAAYYEIFTEVDLLSHTQQDFNSYGVSLLFKFRKTD